MSTEIPLAVEEFVAKAVELLQEAAMAGPSERKLKPIQKKMKVLIEGAAFCGAGNEVLKKALETQFQEQYYDRGYSDGLKRGTEIGHLWTKG